jgi:hypothetical protein
MIDANYALGSASSEQFRRAAQGDLEAQRQLAEQALATRDAAEAAGGLTDLAAIESVYWARLCAANGDDLDAMRLAEALSHMSHCFGHSGMGEAAENLTVEAVSILYALATAGHAPASATIAAVMDGISPILLTRARQMALSAGERSCAES